VGCPRTLTQSKNRTPNPHMQTTDIIGTMGATFTTVSFVLQALHTFKTKDVRGISLGMYCVFITGVGLWLAYGVMLGEWPIIIANGITVSLALAILVMKLRYHEDTPA
jgi:MtN3 and saliva related transmembrane protein